MFNYLSPQNSQYIFKEFNSLTVLEVCELFPLRIKQINNYEVPQTFVISANSTN